MVKTLPRMIVKNGRFERPLLTGACSVKAPRQALHLGATIGSWQRFSVAHKELLKHLTPMNPVQWRETHQHNVY
jgi:hypothetical protein